MRLIDADAVYNKAMEDHQKGEIEDWEADSIIDYLDDAPTINDAEIVVRCRDCAKHYVVLGRDMCAKNASGLKDHLIGLSATLPDAFCSRGVRKDGGENDVSG
jgi:hypothetical protein